MLRGAHPLLPGKPSPAPPSADGNCQLSARETLGPRQRLRHTTDFRDAYDQNRRWHGRYMVLFLRAAPDASRRLGVVASKRVGNAVERARAKRRLREAFRRQRTTLSAPFSDDVVLVARRSILSAPWPDVVADLLHLARQAGLIPPATP